LNQLHNYSSINGYIYYIYYFHHSLWITKKDMIAHRLIYIYSIFRK